MDYFRVAEVGYKIGDQAGHSGQEDLGLLVDVGHHLVANLVGAHEQVVLILVHGETGAQTFEDALYVRQAARFAEQILRITSLERPFEFLQSCLSGLCRKEAFPERTHVGWASCLLSVQKFVGFHYNKESCELTKDHIRQDQSTQTYLPFSV